MIRLDNRLPTDDQAIRACLDGIGKRDLRDRLIATTSRLQIFGRDYVQLASKGELFRFIPGRLDIADPVIIGDIRKSDARKLYDRYIVGIDKPGRKIYSDIMASAEICPMCCGLGQTSNLDHFLPISRFGQFSILPGNLIPCCRDCNMGVKSGGFAKSYVEQPIHPRSDKSIFFEDQWITAEFSGNPADPKSLLNYSFVAPPGWEPEDVERAKRHFEKFALAERYAIQAAPFRPGLVSQITILRLSGAQDDYIRETVLYPVIQKSPSPNHWLAGLHHAFLKWIEEN